MGPIKTNFRWLDFSECPGIDEVRFAARKSHTCREQLTNRGRFIRPVFWC